MAMTFVRSPPAHTVLHVNVAVSKCHCCYSCELGSAANIKVVNQGPSLMASENLAQLSEGLLIYR